MELAEEFERGVIFSRASATDKSALLDEDVASNAFSGSADSALLAPCRAGNGC